MANRVLSPRENNRKINDNEYPKKKSVIIACVLGFILSIFGTIYYGWRVFLISVFNFLLCIFIEYLVGWEFPKWGIYVFPIYWAILNGFTCVLYNETVKEEKVLTEAISKFESVIFGAIGSWILLGYFLIYGLNKAILFWQNGHMIKSILFFALGAPAIFYLGLGLLGSLNGLIFGILVNIKRK